MDRPTDGTAGGGQRRHSPDHVGHTASTLCWPHRAPLRPQKAGHRTQGVAQKVDCAPAQDRLTNTSLPAQEPQGP